MKYQRLIILLLFIVFFLPSQLVAQSQKEEFDSLYRNLKVNFANEKYSEALANLSALKKIIVEEQEIKNASVVESKTKGFDVLYTNAEIPAKLYVGNETVKVHYGDKTVYVVKNNPNSYSDFSVDSELFSDLLSDLLFSLFSSQLPIEFRGKLALENKYLKIGDQTKIVKFTSNNEDILTIDSDGTFRVKKPGNVIITISVDDNLVQIPLKVVEIPLTKEMTRDEVIEILGMPDKVNKKHIGFADSAFVDGIFYSASRSSISVEHWIYKKYPSAILRFGYSGLSGCVMASWEDLFMKKYFLEQK